MNERLCNLFEKCQTPEAPLCPIQENTVKHGIWFADEPICRAKQFQTLPWIKKQRLIAKLRLTREDGFFTVRMLDSLRMIPRNLKGANPDDWNAESLWLKQLAERRTLASQKRQNKTVVRKNKASNNSFMNEPGEFGSNNPAD